MHDCVHVVACTSGPLCYSTVKTSCCFIILPARRAEPAAVSLSVNRHVSTSYCDANVQLNSERVQKIPIAADLVSTLPHLVISTTFFFLTSSRQRPWWQRHLDCGCSCSHRPPAVRGSFRRGEAFSSTCWLRVALGDRWLQSPQAVNPRGNATCAFLGGFCQ